MYEGPVMGFKIWAELKSASSLLLKSLNKCVINVWHQAKKPSIEGFSAQFEPALVNFIPQGATL